MCAKWATKLCLGGFVSEGRGYRPAIPFPGDRAWRSTGAVTSFFRRLTFSKVLVSEREANSIRRNGTYLSLVFILDSGFLSTGSWIANLLFVTKGAVNLNWVSGRLRLAVQLEKNQLEPSSNSVTLVKPLWSNLR